MIIERQKYKAFPPAMWQPEEDLSDPPAGYGFTPDSMPEKDIYFFHSDHLGSTSYLTDTAGNVTQFVWYSPYGESIIDEHTTSYENPFKFSGKELDDVTGLYDHGARSRNPITTIWLGVDPLWEKTPWNSPYVYCEASPVRYIDPDGRLKRKANGEIQFDVSSENDVWYFNSTIVEYENGTRIVDAFKAQKGKIYLNNGKAIDAYSTNGKRPDIYLLEIDKEGNIISEELFEYGNMVNASYNCTGKIADEKFIIDASDISLDDLVNIEGYQVLDSNAPPQVGDIGVYVDKKDGKITHYEKYIEGGKVDSKGGYESEKQSVRIKGGVDPQFSKSADYIRLRYKQNDGTNEN